MNDNQSLLCECGNAKAKRAVGCQRCLAIDYERTRGESRRRIMRALTALEWCKAPEIWEYLCTADAQECAALYSVMKTMVDEGLVERRGKNSGMEYRLVQKQRRAA